MGRRRRSSAWRTSGRWWALRKLVYAAHGWAYTFVFDAPTLGYELRKDVRTYVLLALGYAPLATAAATRANDRPG